MHSHSGAKPCLMKLKLSLVKPSWVENLWEKKKSLLAYPTELQITVQQE